MASNEAGRSSPAGKSWPPRRVDSFGNLNEALEELKDDQYTVPSLVVRELKYDDDHAEKSFLEQVTKLRKANEYTHKAYEPKLGEGEGSWLVYPSMPENSRRTKSRELADKAKTWLKACVLFFPVLNSCSADAKYQYIILKAEGTISSMFGVTLTTVSGPLVVRLWKGATNTSSRTWKGKTLFGCAGAVQPRIDEPPNGFRPRRYEPNAHCLPEGGKRARESSRDTASPAKMGAPGMSHDEVDQEHFDWMDYLRSPSPASTEGGRKRTNEASA